MLLFTVLFLLIANSLRSSEMSNNLENEKQCKIKITEKNNQSLTNYRNNENIYHLTC